ncbi:HNH endonuclease domain-containing protein [Roseiflexus sp.]|uniref:HNH endonuclease domain-containing protein n=1 Tax=Roseiflexus sp. TaxID=2562120 RepID=UPI002587B183|nr:HNH endonuclease domain-containing protein [Roseiflexus sp.]
MVGLRMYSLPYSSHLPVSALAASFNDVTNSYKFYWFLSILEKIKDEQRRTLPILDLLAHMLAMVWYPTNYFRLSFGKQDRLGGIAVLLGKRAGLPMNAAADLIAEAVLRHVSSDDDLGKSILNLARYVPYRFLRPFFAQDLRGIRDTEVNSRIMGLAFSVFHDPVSPCLYRFVKLQQLCIEIQPLWFDYLQQNLSILRGFCLWHLVQYLQKNNPNVPNIAGKLFEPQERDLRQAREFWNIVLEQKGWLECIYSGSELERGQFTLDHFIPWSFVTHDALWNIVPASRSANSSKSDNLPKIEHYFDAFSSAQFEAVKIVSERRSFARLLEDHVLLFKVASQDDFLLMDPESFRKTLFNSIAPQIQIARNMGFPSEWVYNNK